MSQSSRTAFRSAAAAIASVVAGFTLLLGSSLPASAGEELADSQTVMLVAKPQLQHPLYGNSVLIAKPLAGGVHVGFIVNKPTRVTLGQAFPDHEPSSKVRDPMFLGGPVDVNMIFALVNRQESPGVGSVQLTPDLFVAIAGETVDKIIEDESDKARFVFGSVIWRPGELQDEVAKGFWYVMEPEASTVLKRDMSGLWEDLVRRSERRASML
jgi:putative transcriptional regulator